jgi:hypothetical protein
VVGLRRIAKKPFEFGEIGRAVADFLKKYAILNGIAHFTKQWNEFASRNRIPFR